MSEEKYYIDQIFSNEKYKTELLKMYDEMQGIRRFKRKLNDIEKELMWYIGDEETRYVPNYVGFKSYAYENYIPKHNSEIVHSTYKEWMDLKNISDIPGYLYCFALWGHLENEEEQFVKAHEKDVEHLSENQKEEFRQLHNKCKLLRSFLRQLDGIVAIFVNSIDTRDVEYLDDNIKNLDSKAVKHRFMEALRKRDKSMAFKLLGRLRELDEGEDYYFEALSHYINEDYEETIRYIHKVEKKDIDYASAIALKLECYALLGNIPEFIRCIYENRSMTFEVSHIMYLLLVAIVNVDTGKDDIADLNPDFLEKINYSEEETTYYAGQLRRLIANIVLEGFEIVESMTFFSDIIENFDSSEKNQRLQLLHIALMLFSSEFANYLDMEYLKDKNVEEMKREIEANLKSILIDQNPDYSFEDVKAALLMQLRLGDSESFISNVCNGFDALISYAQNGENGAEELLHLAYEESSIQGNVDHRLETYIDKQTKEALTQNSYDKKIINILSKPGKIAYESAEWQYQKSQEEDYGWKDAGMISLGFYRILEVELNQRFIIPLLSGIGYEALNNQFVSYSNTLTGDSKNQYKRKWGIILKTYQDMENQNFAGNGFMLGVLDHFFRAIGSEYDANDAVATLIRGHLGNILNSYGIEKFEEGFFEELTNDSTRNKFRNPPAHTKYLPYSVACECREVFRRAILQMGDMILTFDTRRD